MKLKSAFNSFKWLAAIILVVNSADAFSQQQPGKHVIEMLFTSDAHFGLSREKLMGDTIVSAQRVNAAMIKKMNSMPGLKMPDDGGVGSGKKVGEVDYLIQTGDIANRMEIPYQSAAESWQEFKMDYVLGVKLKNSQSKPTKLLLAPGNHDISNAIGFSKLMNPKTDPSAMVGIYNMMLKPAQPKTNETYNYATDKINYSRNIGGVHFVFVTLWPDSAERIWMEKDLAKFPHTTPVIIFCHDQPTCESKHFTNPVPPYDMTAENKFENLTTEHYKEGVVASKDDNATAIEQRGWVKFLKVHTNVKAYFHGNSNYNEFYVYKGPDNDVALNTFRVDSPMKGKYSSKDETKLSFQLISLDPKTQNLTVRECLWDIDPSNPNAKVVFGASKTVSLKVGS